MDEQTIRRLMHQKKKDLHKTDVFQLKYELEKQVKLTKFFRMINWTLVCLMIATFIGALIALDNQQFSVGEETLKFLKQQGWIE